MDRSPGTRWGREALAVAAVAFAMVTAGCGAGLRGNGLANTTSASLLMRERGAALQAPHRRLADQRTGLFAMGSLAAATSYEEEYDRDGTFFALGAVTEGRLGRTGIDSDFDVEGPGYDLTVMYDVDGLRTSLSVATIPLRDRESGEDALEVRLDYGNRWLFPIDWRMENRRYLVSLDHGASLAWLDFEGSDHDTLGAGVWWRPVLWLRVWRHWEVEFYGDLHVLAGLDAEGLVGAATTGAGLRVTFPFDIAWKPKQYSPGVGDDWGL